VECDGVRGSFNPLDVNREPLNGKGKYVMPTVIPKDKG